MSLLANLTTDDSIATEKDSLGTGGPLESGLYNATISLAYLTKAASEALGLVLHLKTDTGRELRQTLWMTSGKEKGCKNYYEKDGQKHYLPGFNHANGLALLTVGKEISELAPEEKVVNVYNRDVKAEVPTKVQMLTELLGKEIIVGVIKQTVDKTVKTDNGYVPTGETRDENDIDKLFRARDRMTVAEIRGQVEEATFADAWAKKWTGVTKMRAKGVAGNVGAPRANGAAGAPATAKKPTTSLFAT